ncbi:oxidoreductase [Streptomyces sp. NPDC087850]|uniref:oxidoreductase n=1 Tax=Streptomyces sp. NPDC087850 TaxID=3365809 RepID=UPI0037F346E0
MGKWTFGDIPDQSGRTAIVTGANSGIGFDTARMLALKGARTVLACRNPEKGEAAAERIRAAGARGEVAFVPLDLSDLESVAAFAGRFGEEYGRLDLLVNNAGVMVPPLTRTRQGFELQMGTNHFGHFALTGRLLPLLERTEGARVVSVASLAQYYGWIGIDDLNWERRSYRPWLAYGQSKLANMLFILELQRRLTAAGSGVRATIAHPGVTTTELIRTAKALEPFISRFGMKAADGALPTLRAATDPAAAGGTYWGPGGLFGTSGPPVPARTSGRAKDAGVARRLWEESEKLTGVTFAFGGEATGKA